MRILLLGANGQVGWELRSSLAGMGELVTTARTGQADLILNTTDLPQLHHTLDTVRPDLIVNATAYTAVDQAESEPDLAMLVNGTVPEHLGIWAAHHGARVVHYSTDYVFDGTKDSPYLETDTPNPLNVYGKTKLAGDEALLKSGCDALILRVSWVYGLRGSNFLLTMQKLMQERTELRIVDDQFGAPTWCGTIAEVTRRAIDHAFVDNSGSRVRGVYHCAPRGSTSWYGFATLISETMSHDCALSPIPAADYRTVALRPANSRMETQRLERLIQAPLPSWHESFAKCITDICKMDERRL
jgi:dTDP-4-dehydrorhamnose reductase